MDLEVPLPYSQAPFNFEFLALEVFSTYSSRRRHEVGKYLPVTTASHNPQGLIFLVTSIFGLDRAESLEGWMQLSSKNDTYFSSNIVYGKWNKK